MDLKDSPPPITAENSAPTYTPFQTSFASISLHCSDYIRLLQFSEEEISNIRLVIQRSWSKGIQSERRLASSFEFRLKGNPWEGQGDDAIPSCIVIREILAYLFSIGWLLCASTDISRGPYDKDTLIFRKQAVPPPESEWISISFNCNDRLRLIGGTGELREAFRELLKNMGILQNGKWKQKATDAWEFKIRGNPWVADESETMRARLLVLRMIETLEGQGWSLYSSLGQSGKELRTSEADTWFCVKDKQWELGKAVFHR